MERLILLACLPLWSSNPPPPPLPCIPEGCCARGDHLKLREPASCSKSGRVIGGEESVLGGFFFVFFLLLGGEGKISTHWCLSRPGFRLSASSSAFMLPLPRQHQLRTSFGLPRTDSGATHQPLGAVKSSGGGVRGRTEVSL